MLFSSVGGHLPLSLLIPLLTHPWPVLPAYRQLDRSSFLSAATLMCLPLGKQNQANHPTQTSNPGLVCSWSPSDVIQEEGGRGGTGHPGEAVRGGAGAHTEGSRLLRPLLDVKGPPHAEMVLSPLFLFRVPSCLRCWHGKMGSPGGPLGALWSNRHLSSQTR